MLYGDTDSMLKCCKVAHYLLAVLPFTVRTGIGGMALEAPYTLAPLKLGMEVRGIDLRRDIPETVIEQIKRDVLKHRILVFRDQGVVSGDRQVEISGWFGPLESTFYKHHKSPHPDVFRVSNSDAEGCRGVGRTGWHIDGSFQPAPFSFAIYHIWSVPSKGSTDFVPLTELIEQLSLEKRKRWERLWMLSDRRAGRCHPLIYSHPITGKRVLCFHLGMTEAFVYDYGTENERITDWQESVRLLKEIHFEIIKNNRSMIYEHQWKAGDFIISDNLAVGHEANPNTQLPPDEVGLRVMHRCTVKGYRAPTKDYDVKKELKELEKRAKDEL